MECPASELQYCWQRVDPHCTEKLEELNHVQPPLPTLHFDDVASVLAQFFANSFLAHAGRHTSVTDDFEQDSVLHAT